MKRIPLQLLHAVAPHRPDGYLEECMKRGQIEGEFLLMEDRDYADIRRRSRRKDKAESVCRSCDQFWADALWCMAPECHCPRRSQSFRPWLNLGHCPRWKW